LQTKKDIRSGLSHGLYWDKMVIGKCSSPDGSGSPEAATRIFHSLWRRLQEAANGLMKKRGRGKGYSVQRE